MNQILFNKKFKNFKKHIQKLKLQFILSVILLICSFTYIITIYYKSKQNENFSASLLNNFNIESLYSANKDYIVIELNSSGGFFVIGVIEIPKINIKYPILSDTNDELLKIAPCRFYGPYPNEEGNLCIAAHNYEDERFFSNLFSLNLGDFINIYDSSNSKVSYYIYDIYETHSKDTSCTSQNTNEKKEITLITCNNVNKKRLIVKAREIYNK